MKRVLAKEQMKDCVLVGPALLPVTIGHGQLIKIREQTQ